MVTAAVIAWALTLFFWMCSIQKMIGESKEIRRRCKERERRLDEYEKEIERQREILNKYTGRR